MILKDHTYCLHVCYMVYYDTHYVLLYIHLDPMLPGKGNVY